MPFVQVLSSFRSMHLRIASVNPAEPLWTPFLTYREAGKVPLAVAVQYQFVLCRNNDKRKIMCDSEAARSLHKIVWYISHWFSCRFLLECPLL